MPGGMSFELTDDQELIRKSVAELAGKFDDHYWMEKDLAHEFPQEFYDAIAKGGWLGMTIPEEYGGHGLGITEATLLLEEVVALRRGDERRQRHPPVDLRHAARRQARLRRAQGRHAAADRQRRPARVLRRHRTRCGTGHLAHHHVRQARGRPLPHQRPQGVDLQGAGVGEDPAADPHHAVRRGHQEDRRHDAVPDRPGPRPRRHPADQEDGPQRRQLQRVVHRRPDGAGRATGSARRARASSTSSTGSTPSGC